MGLLNKYLRGKDWLAEQHNRNRKHADHIDAKTIKSTLADEISFKLLATRNHPDYEWLKEKLKNHD